MIGQNQHFRNVKKLCARSVFCSALLLLVSWPLWAKFEDAVAALETFLATIRTIDIPVEDQARHDELVAKANAFLDLESMAEAALGYHWREATQQEQTEFTDLLWQLIEHVAYPAGRDFIGQYTITYPEVHKQEHGFEVHSVVKQADEAFDASVIYHLYQNEGQWKIDNIILDDVSMIEDLSYQFDKIIKDSSFSGLLERMREKLTEAREKNKGAAA